MKSTVFRDMVKPVLVLTVICLVAAALLSAVNGKTAPVIEENARIKADATRREVLPGANSFTAAGSAQPDQGSNESRQ